MARFPRPKSKTDARTEWASSVRDRLPDWLDEKCPSTARGAVAGNGSVDVIIGTQRIAGFLPTATGVSVYFYGATDTDVKRIERLCDRAHVPEDARPPRSSKYVLVKVKDDATLDAVGEALRLHCIGKA